MKREVNVDEAGMDASLRMSFQVRWGVSEQSFGPRAIVAPYSIWTKSTRGGSVTRMLSSQVIAWRPEHARFNRDDSAPSRLFRDDSALILALLVTFCIAVFENLATTRLRVSISTHATSPDFLQF